MISKALPRGFPRKHSNASRIIKCHSGQYRAHLAVSTEEAKVMHTDKVFPVCSLSVHCVPTKIRKFVLASWLCVKSCTSVAPCSGPPYDGEVVTMLTGYCFSRMLPLPHYMHYPPLHGSTVLQQLFYTTNGTCSNSALFWALEYTKFKRNYGLNRLVTMPSGYTYLDSLAALHLSKLNRPLSLGY